MKPIELEVPVEDAETPDTPEVEEAPDEGVEAPEDAADGDSEGEQDTFPRSYVEKLRRESAEHRTRAARADELAGALWESRVSSLGRLADPTDLPLPEDADPLDNDAVTAAVDDLLARKPHLASRQPRGDAGQGVQEQKPGFSLANMIRQHA